MQFEMAMRDNTLIGLCKLYNGGKTNPYDPNCTQTDDRVMEYLKFHVWDAEFAFVASYGEWLDLWQRNESRREDNDPKSVYHFVIECKLMKMQCEDMDFEKLYHEL